MNLKNHLTNSNLPITYSFGATNIDHTIHQNTICSFIYMFCDRTLPLKKQNSSSCSVESSTHSNIGSNLTVSLATAAICLLNSHQAVATTDYDPHLKSLNYGDIHADRQHNHAASFFPRILSLFPTSVRTQVANWSQKIKRIEDRQHSPNYTGMGGSYTQDSTPLYLSLAQSTSTKEFGKANIKTMVSSATSTASKLAAKPQTQLQTYTVKAGDTINRIAKKHRVSRDEIIKLNNIKNSNVIFVSQKLQIPVAQHEDSNSQVANSKKDSKIVTTPANLPTNSAVRAKFNSPVSSNSFTTNNANRTTNLEQERLAKLDAELKRIRAESNRNSALKNEPVVSSVITESKDSESISDTAVSLKLPPIAPSKEYLPDAFDGYAWPAKGVLTSGYGWRWGRLHKGIDIAGPVGTPVFAAASGEVISAGWNSGGYGNLIKLRHLNGSVTIYAHNNKILVSSGQKVAQGDQIAEMGNTGFSTGSHLHFEIHSREQGAAVNPLALLD